MSCINVQQHLNIIHITRINLLKPAGYMMHQQV